MKRPAFQFYPADWRKDAELQSCSIAARGLWVEMLCIMHESSLYGHLAINGKPMTAAQLARLVGESEKNTKALLEELEGAGVFSTSDSGCIFSRRMVKDEEIRNIKAEAGKAGKDFGKLGAEHGKKGGRPKKDRGDIKTPHITPQQEEMETPEKPSPSSSSSSSSSFSTTTATDAGEAGDDLVDPPEDRIQPVSRGAGDPQILITASWKPSEHFDAMATMAGIRMDDETRKERVAEFISYWLPRSEIKTQADWDHGLLQACIRWKNKNPPAALSRPKQQTRSALHTFDDVDYSFGVNPDGSF